MSEFDEKLSSILGSQGAMEQIMALAQSLSGEQKPEEAADAGEGSFPAADPEMIRKGEELVRKISDTSDPGAELMRALTPYLKEERRERLERALQLARTTRLIRTAIGAMNRKEEAGDV